MGQGTKFTNDFGVDDLQSAIEKITAASPNTELRRLTDRLAARMDPPLRDIRIHCPDGSSNLYQVDWLASRQWIPLDSSHRILAIALEHYDRSLLANSATEGSSQRNQFDYGEYELPEGTIMTLQPLSGSSVLVFPIGRIKYEKRQTGFLVVRVLSSDQYWVMLDHTWMFEIEHSPDDNTARPTLPSDRSHVFPGTSQAVAIVHLAGFFGPQIDLRIVTAEGFYFYEAGRIDGVTRTLDIARDHLKLAGWI